MTCTNYRDCEKFCYGDCGDCDMNTDSSNHQIIGDCGDLPCSVCIQVRRGRMNENPFDIWIDRYDVPVPE
jgi:hypothetical protein